MTIDLFLLHLRDFVREHRIPTSKGMRLAKCQEEDEELAEAYQGGDHSAIVSEACDRLITAFLLLDSLGVNDPLHAAWEKLQLVRERPEYKELRNGRCTDGKGDARVLL